MKDSPLSDWEEARARLVSALSRYRRARRNARRLSFFMKYERAILFSGLDLAEVQWKAVRQEWRHVNNGLKAYLGRCDIAQKCYIIGTILSSERPQGANDNHRRGPACGGDPRST